MNPKMLAFFMEATPESATKAAESAFVLLREFPAVCDAMIGVEGYDNDPRELDQIPEASRALLIFGTIVGVDTLCERFRPDIASLILVCMGWGERVGTQFLLRPPFDAGDAWKGRKL